MAKKKANGAKEKNGVRVATLGPKQRELPTMERPRIGELDAEIEDQLRAEGVMERAKKAIDECKASIQLLLDEHKLSHYDYVDGEVTERFFREKGPEKLKHITITTEPKKPKKEKGGDRERAKKPEPVMPAPQPAA